MSNSSKKKIVAGLGVIGLLAGLFTAPVAGIIQAVSVALVTQLENQESSLDK